MATDGPVVIELPHRHGALDAFLCVAELRHVFGAMGAVALGLQGGQGVARRATPERERAAGQPAVDLAADAEPVVDVVRAVPDHLGDLVPDGPPGGFPGQVQTGGQAAGETEGEIDGEQGPFAPLGPVGEQLVQQGFRLAPGGGVVGLEGETEADVTLENADPNGIRTGGRLGGRAPMDGDIGVEQAGHFGSFRQGPRSLAPAR